MAPEEKRRLYVAAPPSWKGYKPCSSLAVPSSSVFAYNSNASVEVNGAGLAGRERDVYMQVRIVGHVVMVIRQFLERA